MSRLVVGRHPALVLAHGQGPPLRAKQLPVPGTLEVVLGDGTRVPPGGRERRLVHEVGEVRAGEPRRPPGERPGDRLRVRGTIQGHLPHVHAQDGFPAAQVRVGHHHLPVEPPGTQERRVEHVRPVRRRQDDDLAACPETVHLDEHLVERLLSLVVAEGCAAPGTAERVDLVDEDDAGRVAPRGLEGVAHPARTDADEHLDEVRAGDRIERHVRLARDGSREQGLSRARRPDQQDAAGYPCPDPAELRRIRQEVHDLQQVVLGVLDTGHVIERDLSGGVGRVAPGLAAAERERSGSALRPGAERHPCHEPEHAEREEPTQHGGQQPRAGPGRRGHVDSHGDQLVRGVRVLRQRGDAQGAVRVLEASPVPRDGHGPQLPGPGHRQHRAVGNRGLDAGTARAAAV